MAVKLSHLALLRFPTRLLSLLAVFPVCDQFAPPPSSPFSQQLLNCPGSRFTAVWYANGLLLLSLRFLVLTSRGSTDSTQSVHSHAPICTSEEMKSIRKHIYINIYVRSINRCVKIYEDIHLYIHVMLRHHYKMIYRSVLKTSARRPQQGFTVKRSDWWIVC